MDSSEGEGMLPKVLIIINDIFPIKANALVGLVQGLRDRTSPVYRLRSSVNACSSVRQGHTKVRAEIEPLNYFIVKISGGKDSCGSIVIFVVSRDRKSVV